MNITLLKQSFLYDEETGDLTWRIDRPLSHFKSEREMKIYLSRFAGKSAGYVVTSASGKKYIKVSFYGKMLFAHRICWAISRDEYGCSIDHINGDGTDNRICNLRAATNRENSRNQKIKSNNTSGVSGVRFNKSVGKWSVRINTDEGRIHLGYFERFEDAACERIFAEVKHGYHVNHGSRRDL